MLEHLFCRQYMFYHQISIMKPRDIGLESPNRSKIYRRLSGRSVATNTSQISERHDCFSTQSRDFDTSQNLVISRLRSAWWLEDHLCSCDLVKFTKWYSDDAFVRELLICWKILVMVTTPMNSAVKCELALNSTVIFILKQLLSYSRKGD